MDENRRDSFAFKFFFLKNNLHNPAIKTAWWEVIPFERNPAPRLNVTFRNDNSSLSNASPKVINIDRTALIQSKDQLMFGEDSSSYNGYSAIVIRLLTPANSSSKSANKDINTKR